jgi:hypothetical protein
MQRAPTAPNIAGELKRVIRTSLPVRVRIWDELPENEMSGALHKGAPKVRRFAVRGASQLSG